MADNSTTKFPRCPSPLPPVPLKQSILSPAHATRTQEEPAVADPKKLSGQKVGAILVIKRTPSPRGDFSRKQHHLSYSTQEIGDHVKVLKFHGSSDVEVENLRTGKAYRLALPDARSSTPTSTATPSEPSKPETKYKIADPTTIEGQSPGSMLLIKQKPIGTTLMKDCAIEVGDHIEVIHGIPQDAALIKAKNLRTGAVGLLLWEAVFPVTRRKVCDCNQVQRRCWCVYMDFSHSMAYNKNPAKV